MYVAPLTSRTSWSTRRRLGQIEDPRAVRSGIFAAEPRSGMAVLATGVCVQPRRTHTRGAPAVGQPFLMATYRSPIQTGKRCLTANVAGNDGDSWPKEPVRTLLLQRSAGQRTAAPAPVAATVRADTTAIQIRAVVNPSRRVTGVAGVAGPTRWRGPVVVIAYPITCSRLAQGTAARRSATVPSRAAERAGLRAFRSGPPATAATMRTWPSRTASHVCPVSPPRRS